MTEATPKFLKAADGQIYPYNEVFARMGMTPVEEEAPKKPAATPAPAAKTTTAK